MEINYYYDDYCYRIKNKILNIYKFDVLETSYFEIHSFKLSSIPSRYKYILKFIKEENNRNQLSHTNRSYLI